MKSLIKHLFLIIAFTCFTQYANAQVSFTMDKISGCAPLTVTFTNTSTVGNRYDWYIEDTVYKTSNVSQKVIHTFKEPGGYDIYLIAYQGQNFLDYSSGTVEVLGNYNFFSMSADSACPGERVYFEYYGEADSLVWKFPDGTTDTLYSTSKSFATTGTKNIMLIVSSSCGTDTINQSVVISNTVKPDAFFYFYPNLTCPNRPVTFYPTYEGYKTYTWNFGDGVTDTLISPSHSYSATGTYKITLTTTNTCGNSASYTDSIEIDNVVPFDPWVQIGAPTEACPGDDVVFYADASSSYLWNFGDGGTATTQRPSHKYTAAGIYNVSVKLTNECGNDTTLFTTIDIHNDVYPDFYIDAIPYNSCVGDSVIFYTNIKAASYLWDFEDGTTSTTVEEFDGVYIVKHAFSQTGQYVVKLTATNNCGNSATDSVVVDIYTGNIFVNGDFTTSTPANGNDFVTCEDVSFIAWGGQTYAWNFGDGTTGSGSTPVHRYSKGGTYKVAVTATNGCGNSKTYKNDVTVTKDIYTVNVPSIACTNTSVSFSTSAADAYLWDFLDGTTAITQNPSHIFTTPGVYNVSVKLTKCGFDTTLISQITVSICTSVDEVALKNAGFKLYPNPANHSATITYNLQKNTTVEISLVDILGRQIETSLIKQVQGNHSHQLDVSSLQNGLYLVTLKADGKTTTARLVVNK